MARYRIVLSVEGSRLDTVKKKAVETFPECTAQVQKIDLSRSRADRLSDIESDVEDAKSSVEELRDEIQEWVDALPENLQSGSKADELNDCVSALEEIIDGLEGVDFSSVSFPGMF